MVDSHRGIAAMASECVLLHFGPVEAHRRSSELRTNGTRTRLARQAFQVLELLAGPLPRCPPRHRHAMHIGGDGASTSA